MSEHKHTPGPWEIENHQGKRGSWIGHVTAEGALRCAALVLGETDEVANANARLIAAAPQLLEALIKARAALHQHYVDRGGEPEDAVALQLARTRCDTAIAEATGRQPHE